MKKCFCPAVKPEREVFEWDGRKRGIELRKSEEREGNVGDGRLIIR